MADLLQCPVVKTSCYWKDMWQRMNNMRLQWQLCDVTLMTDDNVVFKGHSLVLAASSDLFYAHFVQQSSSSNTIQINGIKADALEVTMDFIYGVTPTTKAAFELLHEGAEKLGIPGATKYCQKKLSEMETAEKQGKQLASTTLSCPFKNPELLKTLLNSDFTSSKARKEVPESYPAICRELDVYATEAVQALKPRVSPENSITVIGSMRTSSTTLASSSVINQPDLLSKEVSNLPATLNNISHTSPESRSLQSLDNQPFQVVVESLPSKYMLNSIPPAGQLLPASESVPSQTLQTPFASIVGVSQPNKAVPPTCSEAYVPKSSSYSNLSSSEPCKSFCEYRSIPVGDFSDRHEVEQANGETSQPSPANQILPQYDKAFFANLTATFIGEVLAKHLANANLTAQNAENRATPEEKGKRLSNGGNREAGAAEGTCSVSNDDIGPLVNNQQVGYTSRTSPEPVITTTVSPTSSASSTMTCPMSIDVSSEKSLPLETPVCQERTYSAGPVQCHDRKLSIENPSAETTVVNRHPENVMHQEQWQTTRQPSIANVSHNSAVDRDAKTLHNIQTSQSSTLGLKANSTPLQIQPESTVDGSVLRDLNRPEAYVFHQITSCSADGNAACKTGAIVNAQAQPISELVRCTPTSGAANLVPGRPAIPVATPTNFTAPSGKGRKKDETKAPGINISVVRPLDCHAQGQNQQAVQPAASDAAPDSNKDYELSSDIASDLGSGDMPMDIHHALIPEMTLNDLTRLPECPHLKKLAANSGLVMLDCDETPVPTTSSSNPSNNPSNVAVGVKTSNADTSASSMRKTNSAKSIDLNTSSSNSGNYQDNLTDHSWRSPPATVPNTVPSTCTTYKTAADTEVIQDTLKEVPPKKRKLLRASGTSVATVPGPSTIDAITPSQDLYIRPGEDPQVVLDVRENTMHDSSSQWQNLVDASVPEPELEVISECSQHSEGNNQHESAKCGASQDQSSIQATENSIQPTSMPVDMSSTAVKLCKSEEQSCKGNSGSGSKKGPRKRKNFELRGADGPPALNGVADLDLASSTPVKSSTSKTFTCRECGEVVQSFAQLQTHSLRYHGKGRLFTCCDCEFKSPRKKDVQAHMLSKHRKAAPGLRVFKCDHCDYMCMDKHRHEEHMASHSGEARFQCTMCERSYTTRRGLYTHLQYHSQDRPHTCAECGAAFKVRDKLRDHIRLIHTHKGQKPYKCGYCQHASALRGNCNQHIRKTHPDKPIMVIDLLADQRGGKKAYGYSAMEGDGIRECNDVKGTKSAPVKVCV